MSGSFNPVNLVSQAALAVATGGTSLVAQMAMQVASQMVSQIVQNLGQQLGLPQEMIDVAKDAAGSVMTGGLAGAAAGAVAGGASSLASSIEEAGQATGATPSEIGAAQGEAERTVGEMVSKLSEGEDFKQAKATGKGGGWLMAMATVLGKQLNDMAADMESMAGQISKDTPDLTAKFGALSQQFGILMNATTNAIKTIGEAMANTARKG